MILSRNFALVATLFIMQMPAQSPSRSATNEPGRSAAGPSLRDTIALANSALFEAFNRRDLGRLGTFFARDLEFYQDNEGVEDYTQTMHDFVQMFNQSPPIHRLLVPGTLEVYPIKRYGAIEAGSHRFCHVENGRDDCGTFKFVHIWRRTDAGWQISRVVSYAH